MWSVLKRLLVGLVMLGAVGVVLGWGYSQDQDEGKYVQSSFTAQLGEHQGS